MNPVIGTVVRDRKVHKAQLDPVALLATHMAVVASSGGGKSWLLRLILEQTFGLFPHIVIDVEGELKTLREKFDYIIASADDEGDCYAHPRTAKLLARRLLELNASCIIDIYELSPDEKVMFVKEFVNTLVNAPKALWGQRLVVIDEAHQFVPQNNERGQASRSAVVNLLDKGRKRGLSTILASQRVSKVSKDALGECRNKFFGYCNLAADRKRATEELGFLGKKDQEKFLHLDTGHFFAVGPAISKREVIELRAATKVQTTHPRPGEGIQAHTPPPKARVKKLLKELQDLPEQAKKEAGDLKEAQKQLRELNRALSEAKKGSGGVSAKEVTTARREGHTEGFQKASVAWEEKYQEVLGHLEVALGGQKMIQANMLQTFVSFEDQIKQLKMTTKNIMKSSKEMAPKSPGMKTNRATLGRQGATAVDKVRDPAFGNNMAKVVHVPPGRRAAAKAMASSNGSGDYSDITGGCRRLVEVLVSCRPARFTKPQWASLAKLSHKSGTFGTYLSKLRTAGLVYEESGLFGPTENATDWLSDIDTYSPPESNEDVVAMWKSAVQGTPAKMIDVLMEEFPESVSREEMGERLGITHTSGTFGTYLSKLRSNQLVEVNGQQLRAGDPLLWEPGG